MSESLQYIDPDHLLTGFGVICILGSSKSGKMVLADPNKFCTITTIQDFTNCREPRLMLKDFLLINNSITIQLIKIVTRDKLLIITSQNLQQIPQRFCNIINYFIVMDPCSVKNTVLEDPVKELQEIFSTKQYSGLVFDRNDKCLGWTRALTPVPVDKEIKELTSQISQIDEKMDSLLDNFHEQRKMIKQILNLQDRLAVEDAQIGDVILRKGVPLKIVSIGETVLFNGYPIVPVDVVDQEGNSQCLMRGITNSFIRADF